MEQPSCLSYEIYSFATISMLHLFNRKVNQLVNESCMFGKSSLQSKSLLNLAIFCNKTLYLIIPMPLYIRLLAYLAFSPLNHAYNRYPYMLYIISAPVKIIKFLFFGIRMM